MIVEFQWTSVSAGGQLHSLTGVVIGRRCTGSSCNRHVVGMPLLQCMGVASGAARGGLEWYACGWSRPLAYVCPSFQM